MRLEAGKREGGLLSLGPDLDVISSGDGEQGIRIKQKGRKVTGPKCETPDPPDRDPPPDDERDDDWWYWPYY